MFYKGKEIAGHIYVCKEEMISELYHNSQEFDLDDIEGWKEAIIKKTEELKSKGVDFKDVKLNIVGDAFHYNPNGADDEPYMNISIQWKEMETDEEREIRIERKKRWIDQEIEDEKERAEYEKQQKENELWKAIETIKRHGYNVI